MHKPVGLLRNSDAINTLLPKLGIDSGAGSLPPRTSHFCREVNVVVIYKIKGRYKIMSYDFKTIQKLNIFEHLHLAYPIEIRTLPNHRNIIHGAIVDTPEVAKSMADAFVALTRNDPQNIFITFNPARAECMALEHGCDVPRTPNQIKKAISDSNIAYRRYILVDADPVRVSGVPSTDAEKAEAYAVIQRIYTDLLAIGYPDMYVADSGNGYHLLIPVNLSNDAETLGLVKRFLAALSKTYGNSAVDIDISVSNAARLTKLYGTLSIKGRHTPDRPHRLSALLYAPESHTPATVDQLELIAGRMTDSAPTPQPKNNNNTQKPTDNDYLIGFLTHHNIAHRDPQPYNGGIKILLEACPFDASHGGTEVAVFQLSSGALVFKCQHNSCSDKKWSDFRKFYEPDGRTYHDTTRNLRARGIPQHQPKRSAPESYNPWILDYSTANNLYQYTSGIICRAAGHKLELSPLSDERHPIVYRLKTDIHNYMLEDNSYTAIAREACIKALPMYDMSKHKQHGICFKNGWLDMQSQQWHDTKDDFTFPVVYDFDFVTSIQPTAMFDSYLKSQEGLFEMKDYIMYMIGDCISPYKSDIGGVRKAYLIQGTHGSGKSSMVKLIRRMLPEESVVNMTIKNLTEPAIAISAIGKTLIYSSEGCGGVLTSEFTKKAIDGDTIPVHAFHTSRSMLALNATILWAENEMPKITGDKASISKRIATIPFTRTMRDTASEIQNIDEVIAKSEMPQIVINAINAWVACMRSKRRPTLKVETSEYLETDASSVHSFVFTSLGFTAKSLSVSPDGDVKTLNMTQLYNTYKDYMKEDNGCRHAVPKAYFNDVLREEVLPLFGYISGMRCAKGNKSPGACSCVEREASWSDGNETHWAIGDLVKRGVKKELIGGVMRGLNQSISDLYVIIRRLNAEEDDKVAKQEAFDSLTKDEADMTKQLMEAFGATMEDIKFE